MTIRAGISPNPPADFQIEWKDASKQERIGFVLVTGLFASMIGMHVIYGKVEQVRYLGATPTTAFTDGTLLLTTAPPGTWLSQPNELFRTLKEGCVYNFRHYANCGGDGCKLSVKYLRGVELVHCEPQTSN